VRGLRSDRLSAGAGLQGLARPLTVALTLALLGPAACRSRAVAPPAGGGAAEAPVRAISLHDVTTEAIVAAGGAGRLVGVVEPVTTSEADRAALAGVARVGSVESILALRPSVVLGLAVVAREDPDLVAALRGRGIPVELWEPRTLDDSLALVRAVAARVGLAARGDAVARALAARVGALAAAAPAVRAPAPTRVFVYDCCDPPFTAGGGTVLSDLIARAGGDNVFADLDAGWTAVSWEQVIARRPGLIVIDAYGGRAATDGAAAVERKRATLRRFSALAGVPTVVVPLGAVLGGPRVVDAIEILRAALAGAVKGAG